jgi:DNA-binding LytR/AlgR family response regulator
MNENETPKTYGRIVFPDKERTVIEKSNTIAWIEGDSNYIIIHFKSGEFKRIAVCLKWIMQELAPEMFFRIHDRHIVNGNWITGYSPEGERYQVRIKKGDPLYVSRKRRDGFELFIYPYLPDGFKRKKN